MNFVHLLPVGTISHSLLENLRADLPKSLRIECEIHPLSLDPAPSYHAERQQFHSSELLQRMHEMVRTKDWRLLAITDVDLYIPILKCVFGEAQMGGSCAIVSIFRLRQGFYGLPEDEHLLQKRLLKESLHELGHTLHLRHCEDYRCAMASSHAVEWIDLRESSWCESCCAKAEAMLSAKSVLADRRI